MVLRLSNATGNRGSPGLSLPAVVVRFGRAGELVPHLSLRLTAMVVALVLLSHTVAVGGTAYLCRIDGRTHSSCCCETQRPDQQTACVRPQSSFCCDVRVSTTSQPPAKLREAVVSMRNSGSADFAGLPVFGPLSPKTPTYLAFEGTSPPARNRTIQVLVCSFLI